VEPDLLSDVVVSKRNVVGQRKFQQSKELVDGRHSVLVSHV
jgi:hypothetical protein